jgi:ferredoxin
MTDEIYERLADALDRLPNGFTRTPAQVEIQILKKIFSPDEAALAGQLTGKMETVSQIAQRVDLPVSDVTRQLSQMAKRGLVWLERQDGKMSFRLAPFVVGIYEAQVDLLDHELAYLVETYMTNGGAAGITGPQPALHRVIPAQDTVKSEWIMPYDDVRAILLSAKTYHGGDCICRIQRELIGHKCEFPKDVCLSFSGEERAPIDGDLTQGEALALLARTEDIGLVHTVSNVTDGIGYICNCCGCCCGILRGITDWGIEKSVAYANYYAVIDAVLCGGCSTCIERCQVHAINEQGGISVVSREKCIGCGLCVTGCPNDAARLERKPPAEIVQPPANFAAWEHERLVNRGLIN